MLFLFQFLTRELLLSQDRAEQLEARSTQLASLQLGVLGALLQTLRCATSMTARHSRRRRALRASDREEVGCATAEQELVHTAGLLHDIGKFAFPDRILLADRKLADEDWEIVRRTRTRARARPAASTATGRWPRSSSPTTSASTAAATRAACAATRSRCSRG